jgi:ATP-dependent Clp protease ATP-binding subunit ClpC
VILTSNVASADLRKAGRLGFSTRRPEEAGTTDDAMKSTALEGLKRAFRPEFLNRIDQVVVCSALTRENLRQIVDLMLREVAARLREQGITLEVGEDVRTFLIDEGYSEEYGARPLRRAIQSHVDDALVDALLAGELQPGLTARLALANGAVQVVPVEATPPCRTAYPQTFEHGSETLTQAIVPAPG